MEAGCDGVRRKADPWKVEWPDFFSEVETARSEFARLIGATADDIAIVPSVSYGVQIAAQNLPVRRGSRIVVLENQYFSNLYAWQALAERQGCEIRVVARPEDWDWTSRILEAIDSEVSIVALPNCHWMDGSLVDLERVSPACKAVGAALVVDATQSLGALPLSVTQVQPDFLLCAAYKWLLGPFGLAFMYVAPKWQRGAPLEHTVYARRGAHLLYDVAARRAGLVQLDELYDSARRYDVGERSNFILLPMTIVALRQLMQWGVAEIAGSLQPLTALIRELGEERGLVSPPPGRGVSHFVGLRSPQVWPDGVDKQLRARQVYLSVRGNCLRISPHLYNTEADVRRLFAALDGIVN